MNTPNLFWKRAAQSIGALTLATVMATASAAVSEDEWFDPTDWFDGNNIEYDDTYDYDYYDYDYDDGFYDYGYDWDYWDHWYDTYDWDDVGEYNVWGDEDWEDNYYDGSYWDEYTWDNDYGVLDTPATAYDYNASPTRSGAMESTGRAGQVEQAKTTPSRLGGTVTGLQAVQLRRPSGAIGTYTLAKVKLDSGKTTVVNLGRQAQLADLSLKAGDKITAIGQRGTVQGRTVFIAQRLEAKGQRIEANPVIRLQGDTMASARQPRQESLQGQVASVERIKPENAPAEHTLVRLTLEDGTTKIVDLGPAASLERIGLDQGDRVSVRGHRDELEGRNVLVAELLRIDGQRVPGVSGE